MITITHTHADGTLAHGSTRGDGVLDVLRSVHGHWRPFRSLGCLGLVQSRDKPAKTWIIQRSAEALREAGHEVTVSIDDSERRDMATIEAERAERAEARAERLEAASQRTNAQAMADYERARELGSMIPLGQPVMPDHYSYRRDMNYRAKISRTYDRAFAGMDRAGELHDRAEAAEAHQSHRESVPATLRRIKGLEADERRYLRDLDGRLDYMQDDAGEYKLTLVKPGERYKAQLERQLAGVREKLTYWREHVKAAEAGGVKVWTAADFTKGDFVRTRWHWAEVLRVNAKSVSIPWNVNHRGDIIRKADGHYPRPLPYDEVQGHKTAAEIAAMITESQTA